MEIRHLPRHPKTRSQNNQKSITLPGSVGPLCAKQTTPVTAHRSTFPPKGQSRISEAPSGYPTTTWTFIQTLRLRCHRISASNAPQHDNSKEKIPSLPPTLPFKKKNHRIFLLYPHTAGVPIKNTPLHPSYSPHHMNSELLLMDHILKYSSGLSYLFDERLYKAMTSFSRKHVNTHPTHSI